MSKALVHKFLQNFLSGFVELLTQIRSGSKFLYGTHVCFALTLVGYLLSFYKKEWLNGKNLLEIQ